MLIQSFALNIAHTTTTTAEVQVLHSLEAICGVVADLSLRMQSLP